MKGSVVKRLEDLEKQHVEPPHIILRWYDDPEPLDPNAIHVQLRWLEEIQP
jgi:hypothetical protein